VNAAYWHSGKDLIGVQNLIKKNQALISEINNHEPQVAAVVEQGDSVKEGQSIQLMMVWPF